MSNVRNMPQEQKFPIKSAVIAGIVVLLVVFGSKFYKTVPVGHAAVATLFGKIVEESYAEGLHIPVNPLYSWHDFDVREKSHKEQAQVPSQDQLQTSIDVSVQYRLNGDNVAKMLQTTGTEQQLITVQLVPKLRSLLRDLFLKS